MRFYSLERSSPLLDIGHRTYDMGHTTWDIRHMTYDIRHTTYDSRDGFMSFEMLGVVGGGGGGGCSWIIT